MRNKFILVLNFGSSSLKFAVIDINKNDKFLFGIVEFLNSNDTFVSWTINKKKEIKLLKNVCNHEKSLEFIKKKILNKIPHISKEICGIGHRIVHGGTELSQSVIINKNTIEKIKLATPFAPLHNPSHIIGIKLSLKYFSELKKKNVAVFDTNFYKNIPEYAYLYALPYKFYKNYRIKRYGAHGINNAYITYKVSKILNKDINKTNIISCHLGSGSSISAIYNGKCIDTSMGMTPLEGLVMGTRCGDIDPSIIFYLYDVLNIPIKKIQTILTKESGLLGLTNQKTSDCRHIEKYYFKDKNMKRAIDVYCYRLVKYISSYIPLLGNNLDALVFTGGIGENSSIIRHISIKHLEYFGFQIDQEKNNHLKSLSYENISSKGSKISIFVIQANEELIIAKETLKILRKIKKDKI